MKKNTLLFFLFILTNISALAENTKMFAFSDSKDMLIYLVAGADTGEEARNILLNFQKNNGNNAFITQFPKALGNSYILKYLEEKIENISNHIKDLEEYKNLKMIIIGYIDENLYKQAISYITINGGQKIESVIKK